jgi:ligand-binding sensor domain-containing protein
MLQSTGYAQASYVSEESLNARFDYSIKIWNSENGLTQKNILNMVQSKDGFIWFVSETSLTRFDGIMFRSYNAANTAGFPKEGIKDMFEDSQKVRWLVSNRGLIKFSDGKLVTYPLANGATNISHICEDKDQNLLIGTVGGKIYRFKNGVFSLFYDMGPFFITRMTYFNETLYIATKTGLFVLKKHQLAQVNVPKHLPITAMKPGPDNTLYISNQFHLYKMKQDSVSEYKLPASIINEHTDDYFNDFLIDQGRLWLAGKNGVFIVQGDAYSVMNVHNGLTSNEIRSFLKDQENNIWFCTGNAGINKLKPKVIRSYSETENFYGSSSGSIINGSHGSILISSYCKGIYELKNSQFSGVPAYGCIWTLLIDKEGALWGGSYGGGIFRYANHKLEKIYQLTDGLPSDQVFCLYQDRKHTVWAGTSEGLCYYRDGRFVRVKEALTNSINHIMQDKKDQLWFCSKNGLGVIRNGKVRIYTTDDGLPHNNVRYIYEDPADAGTYWIVTYGGGLVRLKNGAFFAFNKVVDLVDAFASCIMEDERSKLWVSTNDGIYAIYKKDLNDYAEGKSSFVSSTYYGRESGMKYTECNGGFQSPGLKKSNGELVFPTINGFVIVDPKKEYVAGYVPDLFIQKIAADNVEFPITDSVIRLPGQTGKLEVHFSAPFFSDPKNLLIRYKLEGLETEWNYMREKRVIIYNNLLPADYSLNIQVLGNKGQVFEKGKRITLIIPSPFYKTWSFLYTLLIGFIFIILVTVYIRVKLIRRNESEKTEINKNYALLELKALQGQMNPHFIFNCLNTIKYFISTDDKVSAGKYLGKFANLVRMFLINSNNNYISLQTEVDLLKLYVELEQLRLDHEFEFVLEVDHLLEKEKIEMPGMLFQPFVENAIHHGLRESENKRVLSIRFKKKGEYLIGMIDDNGIGRAESAKRKSQHAGSHISMGIKTIKERMRTINYIENIHIRLEINDKLTSNGEADGTLVIITIPINKMKTL